MDLNKIALAVLTVCLSNQQVYASTCNTNMSNQTTIANGESCAPAITTQTNSNAVGQTSNLNAGVTVTDGDTITFDSSKITVGGASNGENVRWKDVLSAEALALTNVNLGGKTATISINDPINGQKAIQVYDSNSFTTTNSINGNNYAPVYGNIDSEDGARGAYVNAIFGVVDASQGGGTLNVVYDTEKTYSITGRQNQGLFKAYGSDDAANTSSAKINVKGSSVYTLFNTGAATAGSSSEQTVKFNYSEFTKTPITVNNTSYTITSLDEYKAFNNDLISLLKVGSITEAQYNSYINSVYTTKQYNQVVTTDPVREGDTLTLTRTPESVYYATGKTATINIDKDARVSLGTPYDAGDTLIFLESGAKGYNNGQIGAWNTGVVQLTGNASFENTNTGVMFVGINATTAQSALTNLVGYGYGMKLTASSAVNNGIINVVGDTRASDRYSLGVRVIGNSEFENNGLMIVGAGSNGWIGQSFGIASSNDTNKIINNGEIYIGRAAQLDLSASPGVDIANSSLGTGTGIQVAGTNAEMTNNGVITIGKYIQNAIAIKSLEASKSKTTNAQTGVININGGFKEGDPTYNPLVNYGMFIRNNYASGQDTYFTVNEGTININGVNGVGIHVTGNSSASSSGNLNVTGSSSYDANGNMQNRNYGIQVNGSSANANLSGNLSLNGSGAVGGYVSSGGKLNVAEDTHVSLSTGNNQIGFILSNSGSKINSALTDFAIGTDNSTGFYIINGASFTDSSSVGNALNFDITGKGAKGIIAQNTGTTFTSSNTTYNVENEGAHAIQIRGGATGTIQNTTHINLNTEGNFAAIVDGASYDVFNRFLDENDNVVDDIAAADKNGATTLTSSAQLVSNITDVLGYKVVNSGNLILTKDSSITLTGENNTGVFVDGSNLTESDSASTLNNAGDVAVNGVGIRVSGGKTAVNNSGKITASGGLAGILIENGASLTMGNGSGSTVITGNVIAQGSADGVLIYGDAANAVNNAVLAQENSGLITVDGTGAGIRFTNSDGTARHDDFDISQSQGLTVNVSGANGHGIVANTSGIISTGANVNVNNIDGGAALEITGGATTVIQSGKLISQSTNSPVIETNGTVKNFTNTGTIQAAEVGQDAVNLVLAGATFTNGDQTATGGSAGILSGNVNLAGNNSHVNLNGASQATNIIATGENNTFTLNDVTDSNTHIFTSITGGRSEANTLILENSSYHYVNAGSINQFNRLQLNNGSHFTLNQALDLGAANNIAIDSTSTLAVDPTTKGNYDLANNLTGSGKVTVNNDGIFNLTGNTQGFTGHVALNKTQFILSGQNTANLTNATLTAGAGSYTTLGAGEQSIGGLAFDGGTIAFDVTAGQPVANGSVAANTLDLNGTGTVQLSINPYDNSAQTIDNSLNLLEQDNQNRLMKLATGNTVIGAGGNLVLTDSHGDIITDAVITDIVQDNQKIAEGTYDYRLTGQDDGLYVGYGLTQLNLIGTGEEALTLSQKSGATGNAADMSAKITGAGDLAIAAGSSTVSLSNTSNDYTGATTINSGNLRVDADNALGATTELILANNTGLQLNAHQQTVNGNVTANTGSTINLEAIAGTSAGTAGNLTIKGETSLLGSTVTIGANNTLNAQDYLSADQNSTIGINGGILNLNNGGLSQGALIGSGTLNVNTNTFDVKGANNQLTATTNINNATVNLNNVTGLGSGAINFSSAVDSILNINSAEGALRNNLAGGGLVNINNANVTLVGDNTGLSSSSIFTVDETSQLNITEAKNLGDAEIDLATNANFNLDANTNWTLNNTINGSGNLNKLGAGVITVSGEHVNVTNTTIAQGTLNLVNGTLSSAQTTINADANLVGGKDSAVLGDINNAGNIYVGNAYVNAASNTATTFTINGDLNNTGNVYLSRFDNNLTSAFVGNTLKVDGDLNGDGNYYIQTQVEGLKGDLIVVSGAVNSDNTLFIKDSGSEPIGTEKLTVVQSGATGTGNFALNGNTVDIGAFRYGLQKDDNNWNLYSTGKTPSGDTSKNLSKGANIAVGLHSANASMWEEELGTLMNRMGDLRLDGNREGGVWIRQLSHDIHASPDSSRSYKQHYNGTQLGIDKATDFNKGVYYLGVMTGLSRSHLNFKEASSGSISAQTFGLYATALFDNGYYVDIVAKYGHMKTKSKYYSNVGEKVEGKYSTDAMGLSIEGGKRFTFENNWFIEPQLQLTRSHLYGENYAFDNGLQVKSYAMNLFNGRVGVTTGTKIILDEIIIEPYLEMSHIQELTDTGHVDVNNNHLDSDQIGTRQHYGFGVNMNIKSQHNLFINGSYENGEKMEQPWGVKAGYQFRF